MKGRIGTKHYDTEKAVLIETLPDGVQVYKKKNSPQFFIYNPAGTVARERFFELPPEQTRQYLDIPLYQDRTVRNTGKGIKFSDYNIARIKQLATTQGMSMAQFILMLVDEYERTHK